MRGKEVKTLLNFNRVGITPACAGKRCAVPRLRFAVRDYPRVCGEKAILYTREAALTGSPPRMRGKAFHRFWHHRGQGITPAYAGKRPTQRHGRRYSRDHPRVCGEKNGICRAKVPHLGSPPRMRGKAPLRAWIGCAPGITPAYAGKRHERSSSRTNRRDYPRVCGEKADNDYDEKPIEGSPPRMRGKGPLPRDALPALGITPAYAGKSLWSGSVRVWVWDHPRVCGEKVAVCHDHASGVGSPPRMRGKD